MGAFARTYNPIGVVGYSSDMEKENVITRIASGVVAGTATAIGFAQPVTRGTAAKSAIMWTGANGPCLGLTLASGHIDEAAGYQNGDNVPVINEGQIWAHASGTCTEGSTPLFVPATGGFTNYVEPADPEDADPLALTGAVFNSSATAGGVVTIQLQTRIA